MNFIRNSVGRGQPFLLELATFTPHGPYTPDPIDANGFPGLKLPRTRIFNRPQARPRPQWLSTQKLTQARVDSLDSDFRKRAQAVQSVDRMIGLIRTELAALGVADDTYIAFSSDNGYHLGDRRMTNGKQTAWDHDIRVPLVVVGPGVRAGASVGRIAANTDLRSTFQKLAGVPVGKQVEGRSLVPLLRGDSVKRWRTIALIEHHGPNTSPSDPDRATKRQGNPPSYKALRFRRALYVQYDDSRYRPEYYKLGKDRLERRNVIRKLSRKRRAHLRALVRRFAACDDGRSCRKADR
jgi:arylsulfatase A-like enzyme